MDIDITYLITSYDTWDLTGSVATHGPNAARMTWNNCLEASKEIKLFRHIEQYENCRDFFREFGAWDDEQISNWSEEYCNALTLQHIVSQMREIGLEDHGADFDWKHYYSECEKGTFPSNFFESDGKIYWSMC